MSEYSKPIEPKNMQKTVLLFLMLFSLNCFSQNRALGTWKQHLPYKTGTAVTQIGDEIYCGSLYSTFYSYNRNNGEIIPYSLLNNFSETEVSTLKYDPETAILLIAYENSNIDLLKDGKIINMPEIKNKIIVGDKSIYDIHFIEDLVYLSCGFGIIVIDLTKEEIKDTYYIGPDASRIRINAVADNGSVLVAATELGLMKVNLSNAALFNFTNWTLLDESDGVLTDEATEVYSFDGNLYAAISGILYQYNENVGSWSNVYETDLGWDIIDINAMPDKFLLVEKLESIDSLGNKIKKRRIQVLNDQFGISETKTYLLNRCVNAIFDENGTIWAADNWFGLIKVEGENTERINGIGPTNREVHSLEVDKDRLWICPAQISRSWSPKSDATGLFYYKDDWVRYNFLTDDNKAVRDINDVVVDPQNPDILYVASLGAGLVEFRPDGYDVFNDGNSSLQRSDGDSTRVRVSGLAFDSNGDLWMSNYLALNPISVKTSEGEWQSFSSGLIDKNHYFTEVVVDDFGHKWFVVRNKGILVMDSGDDPLSKSDDEYRLFRNIDFRTGLPSNDANCIVQDLDQEIWVGTDDGIAVFYCTGNPFNENCEFSRPIIVPEGSEVAVLVLDGVKINSITVDGANRKWIGTNNGAFLLSPDSKETVLHFTKENSNLLSNTVKDIVVNNGTGEVFFGTSKGVITYQGDAVIGAATHSDNVLIYPNPVYPDYRGDIAFKGLSQDASVKITDVSGKLVYETQSFGGQATWDGMTYEGNRAKAGVYFILSSNELGTDAYAGKFFIAN